MLNFRVYLSGKMFSKLDWQNYYKREQIFKTICSNCLIIENIKNYLKAIKEIKDSDTHKAATFLTEIKSKSTKEQRLYKEIFKEQLNGPSKALLLKWLGMARAKMLHSEQQVKKREENELVLEHSLSKNVAPEYIDPQEISSNS